MTRAAEARRETRETTVEVSLAVDGTGTSSAKTRIPFFDHMLEQLGRHAAFDLRVRAEGDLEVDGHHTVEDVGIVVGGCLAEALGDKAGIRRFGDATVPIDEALVQAAVDLSGRPFLAHDVPVPAEVVGSYDTSLTEDFLRAFVNASGMTLHLRLLSGRAPHHVVEAEFKALAVALRRACERVGPGGDVPSTKGVL